MAIENGVTIKGIAGYERYAFSTISEAYAKSVQRSLHSVDWGRKPVWLRTLTHFTPIMEKSLGQSMVSRRWSAKALKTPQNNDIVVDNYTLTFGRAASYIWRPQSH